MSNIIDLNESVYELCNRFPKIKPILKELGFENITNPIMMNTAGKIMTLPKAAIMKNISMEFIVKILNQQGFEIK